MLLHSSGTHEKGACYDGAMVGRAQREGTVGDRLRFRPALFYLGSTPAASREERATPRVESVG